MNWYPRKPTLRQLVFGTCFLVALATVSLYWSFSEEDFVNRVFLRALGTLLLAVAVWRVFAVVLLSRRERER